MNKTEISIPTDLLKRIEKCGRMYETHVDVVTRAVEHLEICNCDKCCSQ